MSPPVQLLYANKIINKKRVLGINKEKCTYEKSDYRMEPYRALINHWDELRKKNPVLHKEIQMCTGFKEDRGTQI
jgi:hypothetical protein